MVLRGEYVSIRKRAETDGRTIAETPDPPSACQQVHLAVGVGSPYVVTFHVVEEE